MSSLARQSLCSVSGTSVRFSWAFEMVLVPVVFGLITALCLASSDLLSRGASKVQGPYATAVHQLLIGTIFLIILGAVLSPSLVLTPYSVFLMVSAGILNLGTVFLLYRGLHKSVVSVVAPIVYSYPAITLALSILLLGVSINTFQILALVGIMLGVIMVSTRFSELRTKKHLAQGVYPSILAALCGGLSYLALGASVPLAGPILPTFFLRAVGALMGLTLAPVIKQNAKVTRYTFSPRVVSVGLLAVIAFLVFNTGLSLDPNSLPIVAALAGTASTFEVAFAILFIREKLEPNQAVGILLLVTSVFVLVYFGA